MDKAEPPGTPVNSKEVVVNLIEEAAEDDEELNNLLYAYASNDTLASQLALFPACGVVGALRGYLIKKRRELELEGER